MDSIQNYYLNRIRLMRLNSIYGLSAQYKFKSDRFKYADTDSTIKEKKTPKG